MTKQSSVALPKSLYKLQDGTLVVRIVHRVQLSDDHEPFVFEEVASCLTVALDLLGSALKQPNISEKVIWHHLVVQDPNDRHYINEMNQPGLHIVHYDEYGTDPFQHVMKLMAANFEGLKGRVLMLTKGNAQPCIAYIEGHFLSINCVMCPTTLAFELAYEISAAAGEEVTLPLLSPASYPEFDRIAAGLHFTYIDNWSSKEEGR